MGVQRLRSKASCVCMRMNLSKIIYVECLVVLCCAVMHPMQHKESTLHVLQAPGFKCLCDP